MLNLCIGSINGKPVLRELTFGEKEWLLSQLSHRKSRIRWAAANELGQNQVKESVKPLIFALQDNHWLVRLHAAKALGRIGDTQAVEPLKLALQDDNPYVRRRVIIALGVFGDESVIPLILRTVQADEKMWFYAEKALGNFMGPYATNALINAVHGEDRKWHSGLQSNRASRFTPILLFWLKFSEGIWRESIIKILGKYGDERAAKELEWFATNSWDRNIRQCAYQAFGQIQCRRFEKYLP